MTERDIAKLIQEESLIPKSTGGRSDNKRKDGYVPLHGGEGVHRDAPPSVNRIVARARGKMPPPKYR